MKKFFVCVLLISVGLTAADAQYSKQSPESNAIWFKQTSNFGKRFLYSQAILWPSSIAGHVALYIAKDDFNWSKAIRKDTYKKTFTTWPRIDDDHWSWNYEVHPYMGSVSYLCYRNRNAGILESFAGSALNSVVYEYLIAGGTQPASINDMLVTPIAGSLLGEGLYHLKKYLIKDNYLNTFEKIVITIIDPVEVFYFGFNYRELAKQNYN